MSPIDKASVRRKAAILQQSIARLEKTARLSPEDYLKSFDERKIAERLMQEAIEAAIDINTHVLVDAGSPAPPDFFSSFPQAASIGLIPVDLATRMAPLAGLRNRLVHEYDALDDALVHAAVRQGVPLLISYLGSVEKFLKAP